MAIQRLHKYSGEDRLLTFDFYDKMPDGETLSGATASVEPTDDLTVSGESIDGTLVQVMVSGGTDGTASTVTLEVTCSNSEVYVAKAIVAVDDTV